MPTIGRIGALDVMIFRNDHEPPHFHVIGAEFSAKFTIADVELLSSKGRIRRRDIREIEAWGTEAPKRAIRELAIGACRQAGGEDHGLDDAA